MLQALAGERWLSGAGTWWQVGGTSRGQRRQSLRGRRLRDECWVGTEGHEAGSSRSPGIPLIVYLEASDCTRHPRSQQSLKSSPQRGWIHVYVWLSPLTVHLKPSQHVHWSGLPQFKIKTSKKGLPRGPMAKTLRSHCRGPGSDPLSGN